MHRDEPLVTIASFPTSFEASLARGALEAVGIPASVPDEALGAFSLNRGNVGGLPLSEGGGTAPSVLQVFESDRDRAVAELRRLNMRVVKKKESSD
jgi:hypothetical protein